MLAVAGLFKLSSWRVSQKLLRQQTRPNESVWQTVLRSADPSVFTVFVADSAALAGIAIAVLGVCLSHTSDNPIFDPIASILIGLVLLVAAPCWPESAAGYSLAKVWIASKSCNYKKSLARMQLCKVSGNC